MPAAAPIVRSLHHLSTFATARWRCTREPSRSQEPLEPSEGHRYTCICATHIEQITTCRLRGSGSSRRWCEEGSSYATRVPVPARQIIASEDHCHSGTRLFSTSGWLVRASARRGRQRSEFPNQCQDI